MGGARDGVTFTADGKEYTLRFTTNAIVKFEELTGTSIANGLESIGEGTLNMSAIRSLFCVALGANATLDEAGDLIDAIGFVDAIGHISEAATLAFADKNGGSPPKAKGAKKPPKKK